MKRFSALLLMTLIASGASLRANAETKQCNCTCECETSAPPASLSATPLAIPKPLPPKVDAAQNDILDLAALGDKPVKVELSYPEIANGHTAGLRWKSAVQQYNEPVHTVGVGATSVIFEIPNDIAIKDAGQTVTLTASVGVGDEPLVISQPRTITVINGTPVGQYPAPTVPSATAGQLDLKTLAGKPLKVTYTYDGIAAGHTVGIRWAGNPVYDTPHPVIGATPRPLEFTIPYDKVRLEKDKTVQLTASVGTGSGQLTFSPALSLKVIDSRPRGEEVAADLNARYNDTSAACAGNTPSYYCNGVTIRGTDNGNYDPWDPSPTQVSKGSVSFSYLRKDSKVTKLARTSGYALLSQDQAIVQGKEREYLCSYAHDAWTDIVGRPSFGCGLQPGYNQDLINLLTANPQLVDLLRNHPEVLEQLINNQEPNRQVLQEVKTGTRKLIPELGKLLRESEKKLEREASKTHLADVSTCATVNASTPATWKAYTGRLSHPRKQCSLSAKAADQFNTSVKVREYAIPGINSPWNELLIKIWPKGIPAQLPLAAFYYQDGAGLTAAKAYQTKYDSRTGGQWLPIIKFDAARLNANPFSYSASDQAIQP